MSALGLGLLFGGAAVVERAAAASAGGRDVERRL